MHLLGKQSARQFGKVRRAARNTQQGAVAILVALSLVALVGIVGLALDLGKLFVARAELQNAADACALAAVHSLDGATTRQLDIAEAAGLTVGLRHKVQFQANTVRMPAASSMVFAERMEGPWLPKTDFAPGDPALLRIRHVRCTVAESGIDTWFIQVLDRLANTSQRVSATATASLLNAQMTCAIPVAICAEQIPAANAVGTWLRGVNSPSDDTRSDFRWVNLDLNSSNSSNSRIADMLVGNGACELPVSGAEVGVTGARLSLSKAWNTRFGIYEAGSYQPENHQPDLSGYAYNRMTWPAGPDGRWSHAFQDFIGKRSVNLPYQGDALTGLNTGSGPGSRTPLVSYGGLRRVAPAPVVNCSDFSRGTHQAPIQYWACMFMLHPISHSAGNGGGRGNGRSPATPGDEAYMFLEYLGKASEAGSPCLSTGLPGDVDGNGPLVPVLSR